jgi:hypothetical protein
MDVHETETRIHQKLVAIVDFLSELTGLTSRWNGEVELSQDSQALGRKPFTCRIILNERLTTDQLRWRTLIHEVFHSFSAGYTREDYQAWRGWEEGVVEQLQRLFRPSVLAHLSVTSNVAVFQAIEEGYPFNKYIRALEQLREAIDSRPTQDFYLDLLATEIKDRPGLILSRRFQLPPGEQATFVKLFSQTNSVLKEFI